MKEDSQEQKIGIIDYGMGNIASIINMLKKIGANNYKLVSTEEEINQLDKIILPGVGSFDHGMINLKSKNLIPILNKKVLEQKTPVLGICLGMQLLTNSSEEGKEAGLGWIDAETKKFEFTKEENLKIPHMGWNYIKVQKENALLSGLEPTRFYFVHSYFVECKNPEDVLATSSYGSEFTCSVNHENIWGMQFHPEKSHKFGISLFTNFLSI